MAEDNTEDQSGRGAASGDAAPIETIYQLSSDAFRLAQESVAGNNDKAKREQAARELNSRLDGLWPLIQAAPAGERPGLTQAWTDARLDVGYVLSGGELSTSTRLFYFIEDAKQEKSEG